MAIVPKFDWQKFCATHNIEFVITGPSTTRGNINIKCPFCGEADPSHHMGLHLKLGYWHCWRNSAHAGRNPHRLIMRLLGCTFAEASTYVSEGDVELSDFEEAASKFTDDDESRTSPRHWELTFPKTFRVLDSPRGRARLYWKYLIKRGFEHPLSVARRYDLLYCDKGEWRGRIIMPIREENRLVSWTGRSVYEKEKLRYRSLSHRNVSVEHPTGLINIKDTLYNFDSVMNERPQICAIVEGPFDVMKVDFYGRKYGVGAVGTFGTGIRESQLEMLDRISGNGSRLIVCGDAGAEANVMDLLSKACDIKLEILPLPEGVEDPGDLSPDQIKHLFFRS